MPNINEQQENDLREELKDCHNIEENLLIDIESDSDDITDPEKRMYNMLIKCSEFTDSYTLNKNGNNEYSINIPRCGDLLLGTDIEITRPELQDDELYDHIINSIIKIDIGGTNISCLHVFSNVYLSKIIGKNIKNTDDKIIIPVFGIYHLAELCDPINKGFAFINLQYHNITLTIQTELNVEKYVKLKIKYKNLPVVPRFELTKKEIIFICIKNNLYNVNGGYRKIRDLVSNPSALFIKCDDNVNSINLTINNVGYEYNILRGDAEEIYILGNRYIIIHLDCMNIKHIVKSPNKSKIRSNQSFEINFSSIGDGFQEIHVLFAKLVILSGGMFV